MLYLNKIPESECREESPDSGEPCKIPVDARGLLVETLPSRLAAMLSLPTLITGPIWAERVDPDCTNWPGLVYPLLGLLILVKDGNMFSKDLGRGFQYAAATTFKCLLCPKANRPRAAK